MKKQHLRMKNHYYIVFLLLSFSFFSNSQESQKKEPSFFIQSMINLDSQEQATIIESKLRNNPMVKLCRIALGTKTLFLITQNTQVVNTDVFNSWLLTDYSKFSCVTFGIYGTDKLLNYPVTNCK